MEEIDGRHHGLIPRIVVTGAESTGKTTIAARLAAYYGTVWAPEYVRGFVDEKGAPPEAADVPAIARGHLQNEAGYLRRARGLLVLDTDLLSTVIYSRYYFGTCPEWIEQAARTHHADLYLLADADIPWVPDPGQRDGPQVRERLQNQFITRIERHRWPYVLLSGSLETRLKTAVLAIDAILERPGRLVRHA